MDQIKHQMAIAGLDPGIRKRDVIRAYRYTVGTVNNNLTWRPASAGHRAVHRGRLPPCSSRRISWCM